MIQIKNHAITMTGENMQLITETESIISFLIRTITENYENAPEAEALLGMMASVIIHVNKLDFDKVMKYIKKQPSFDELMQGIGENGKGEQQDDNSDIP